MSGKSGESSNLAAAAVIVSAVMWGLWWLPLRGLAAAGLPGDLASFAIYAAAAVLMLPILLRRSVWRGRDGAVVWRTILVGALFGVVLICWNRALLTGEVVRVTLLFYLAPIWATLLERAFLGIAFGPRRALALVFGLSGAALVLGFEGGVPVPRSGGDWFGLAAGFFFAVVATLGRRLNVGGEVAQVAVSLVAAAAFAPLLLVLFPVPGHPGVTALAAAPAAAWGWAVLAAGLWLLPQTWLLLWGAGRLDPARTSLLLLFEVVAAAVSATILTDEPFGWRQGAGCLLILAAGALDALSQKRRQAGEAGKA